MATLYTRDMPRIKRCIDASKIEYVCDQCIAGVYRLVSKQPVSTDYIYKWRHRCTHCGHQANFTVPYPLLETPGQALPVNFMQLDALPPPNGPGDDGFFAGRLSDGGEFELLN